MESHVVVFSLVANDPGHRHVNEMEKVNHASSSFVVAVRCHGQVVTVSVNVSVNEMVNHDVCVDEVGMHLDRCQVNHGECDGHDEVGSDLHQRNWLVAQVARVAQT